MAASNAATIVHDILSLLAANPTPARRENDTTRLLVRQLKALHLELQLKNISAATESNLVPCLQSLLRHGWQADVAVAAFSSSSLSSPSPSPRSPHKYVPPNVRAYSASSDSDSSDIEGPGAAHERGTLSHRAKVRTLALTCLQAAAKADPKSLHPHWTTLLPDIEDDFDALQPQRALQTNSCDVLSFSSSREESNRRSALPSPSSNATHASTSCSLAHPLLADPFSRVRHAAATTIATILEGPAQRAYLSVSEWRDPKGPAIRGFVPLSASIGRVVMGVHAALLHGLMHEPETHVIVAQLRALGTLLIGAPYHRLVPSLLPRCVDAVFTQLHRGKTNTLSLGEDGDSSGHGVAAICGSLSCLAAAFGVKPPLTSLEEHFQGQRVSREPCSCCKGAENDSNAAEIMEELIDCAKHENNAIKLEALLALRGFAQHYRATLAVAHVRRALDVARCCLNDAMIVCEDALSSTTPPSSPRSHQDGTPQEKIAQQALLLLGQVAIDDDEDNGANGWTVIIHECFEPSFTHRSAVIRAAGFHGTARLISVTAAPLQIHLHLIERLLSRCCAAILTDEASPVRAAASKLLASLANRSLTNEHVAFVLPALRSACMEEILAVRAQGVGALSALATALLDPADPRQGQQPCDVKNGAFVDHENLLALWSLAVAAVDDHEKVKPAGVQALGALLGIIIARFHTDVGLSTQDSMLHCGVEALHRCLSSTSGKLQWSACSAAGFVLRSARSVECANEAEIGALRELLQNVAENDGNAKTRALAETALGQADIRA